MSTVEMVDIPLHPSAEARFSTRAGGVSEGPWSTLNLGLHVGDAPDRVDANRRRWLEALGRKPESVVWLRQVHGADVVAVGGAHGRPPSPPEADGAVTADPACTLVILVADCVPVFLVDPEARVVGLVHAGWRGTVARVAARAVDVMVDRFGAAPERVRAWIGPHIRDCCYEVDEPVVARIEAEFGIVAGMLRPGRPGRAWLSLAAANRRVLADAGVPPAQVGESPDCTGCRRDRFFSYRKEGGRTGRMAAALWLK
ncbi:MAG: peptidoglycan editing factor PgeF [Clostridia bacterium]|nr:peptidoglycan editing factor PgeF [Clostridia bacterium]